MKHVNYLRNNIRQYLSFFRMRLIAGLQYRLAAWSGMVTQLAWGMLSLLLYKAFYEADSDGFPMTFQALASYIWLQQAFLALFMAWFFENEIFDTITTGGIAYELCRPINLYVMWFVRTMANRLSSAVLRCMPILIVAALLPEPYGIGLPPHPIAGLGFLLTTLLGFLVVVAFGMLIYISTFFTYSSRGVRNVAASMVELLAGGVIPLPFLPGGLRKIVELLPWASMQNVPLRVYSGDISGWDILTKAGLQLFWVLTLIWLGQCITKVALKRVVVQGG